MKKLYNMSDNMDISKIHINPNNPRIIKDGKFEKLCRSIQEFPKMLELRPIIVDSDGMILGGNMRFKALQHLKMDIKPEWVKEGVLSDEEKRRFVVEDNVGFGEWNWDELANEYGKEELEDWGLDVEKWAEDEIVEDEPPAVEPDAVSKTGEVYQLGEHRLMCGDATKIEDVEKLMNGQKADMVFTDPPYGMDLDTDYSGMKSKLRFALEKGVKSGKKYGAVIGDDKPFDASPLIDMANEVFLFGGDYYSDTLPKNGSWFVWDKRVEENMDRMFGSTFELVWSKQKHKREIVRIKWAGIFGTEQERGSNRQHPTQKPIQLASWFYKKFSKENDIIVDLYGGSGSFLIACEQTNRTCYMMELDPKYCDVIRKRYAKFIGKEEQWQTITPIIK